MKSNSMRCLMVLTWLAIVLAACGAPPAPAAPVMPEEGAEANTSSRETDKAVLTIWVFEGENEYLPSLEKAFEAATPTVDLKITEFPEDEYTTKIDTALAAGSPPDLGFVYDLKYLKLNSFLPVDGTLRSSGIKLDTFNQGALSECRYEGKLYCIGSYSGALMLFYNKDMFDAAGLPYPAATQAMTLDEYAELAAKLTQPNDDLTKYVWGAYSAPPYWWTDQRLIFSEDGHTVKGIANKPEAVHMYEVLAGMIQNDDAPSEGSLEGIGLAGGINGQGNELFSQKRAAMAIVDSTILARLAEEGIRWGAAPLPAPAGTPAWVPSWTDKWGVFSSSQHPQEALKFISFIATEGNKIRATQLDTIPLDLAMAEQTDWAGQEEGRQQMLEVLKLARPGLFFSGMWDVMLSTLDDTFLDVVDEELTAQEALDEAAETMQKVLDEAWVTWAAIK
jgi:multiple sugar transport system substrate-binding protein